MLELEVTLEVFESPPTTFFFLFTDKTEAQKIERMYS